MLSSNVNHTRPLYSIAYIKEVLIRRVWVDPGSALNLIIVTALQELGVPPNKLTSTKTAIQVCGGEIQNLIEKIKIKFQLGSLVSKNKMNLGYEVRKPTWFLTSTKLKSSKASAHC